MAETFIAIGTAVKTAFTTVSGFFTGGTAAAGAGTAAKASTLSTALSVGSALASIGSGFASAAAARDQARQVGIQLTQEKARDAQRRASLAEEYADLVADQEAVQIANGLNPAVGTPASVRRATREIAERNLATSRENTRLRTQTARLRQRSLFKSANTAILGGFINAGEIGLDAYRAVG